MLKYLKDLAILVSVFLITFSLTGTSIAAGPEVPTNQELVYAKQFLNIYTGLEKSDKRLQEELSKANMATLTPILTEKFNYTKESYLQLSKIQPPAKFANCHNTLIKALYKHLEYLKTSITMAAQKVDIKTFSTHTEKYTPIKNEYVRSLKEFFGIIKTWQEPYVKEVIGNSQLTF